MMVRHRNYGWITALALFLIVGCTANSKIRTDPEPCRPMGALEEQTRAQTCEKNAIEEHPEGFLLGFVEFDDLGLTYDREAEQIHNLLGRIRTEAKRSPISLVVFIHGWRHNARSDDDNVSEFRKFLLALNSEIKDDAKDGRKLIGIYVGWRGKSLAGPELWEYLSFYDRKNSADHVARGMVRELFARLRHVQHRVNERHCNGNASGHCHKHIRMLTIGHSFGGLAAYNGMSDLLMEAGVADEGEDTDPKEGMVKSFGDLVVLVNPALEGVRYEPLHRIARSRSYPCGQKPVFVAVTADNDLATKRAFPVGRWINSLLTSERDNKDINRNTLGHIARYHTHVLTHCSDGTEDAQGRDREACACEQDGRESASTANRKPRAQRALEFHREQLKEGWQRKFCGGAVLEHIAPDGNNPDRQRNDPYNPFWIISSRSERIIDGHNGFFTDAFRDFVQQLYHDVSVMDNGSSGECDANAARSSNPRSGPD